MTKSAAVLMAAMNFTEADLMANRQGHLSPAQVERIKRVRRRHTLMAAVLFLALALAAAVLIFFGQQNRSFILSAAGGLLTMVNALLMGGLGRSYMRTGSDLRAGGVEALAGEVERVLRRGRQQDNYLLRIDGASLYVTKDVFLGFQHEAPYRIYRNPSLGCAAVGRTRQLGQAGCRFHHSLPAPTQTSRYSLQYCRQASKQPIRICLAKTDPAPSHPVLFDLPLCCRSPLLAHFDLAFDAVSWGRYQRRLRSSPSYLVV